MYKVIDILTNETVSIHKNRTLAYKKMHLLDRMCGIWGRHKVLKEGE